MEEFLELIKKFSNRRLIASGQVNDLETILFSAHLVADSGGTATAIIYDGQSASDKPIVDLSAPLSSVDRRFFIPPLYFSRGLYVDFGSHVTSVLLQFRQTRDLEPVIKPSLLKSWLPSWLGGAPKEVKIP